MMKELWPWLVMALGVIALFAYRFWTARPKRLYASMEWRTDDRILGSRSLESRAPRKIDNDVEVLHAEVNAQMSESVERSSARAIGHDWMPMAISLLVLLSALFVILSNNNYADAQQKWAFGVVGTILGYWFKR
jgi:hypothetical protein